jgi:hypothetical protein
MKNTNIVQYAGKQLPSHKSVPMPLCPLYPMWTGLGLKLEIKNEELVRQTDREPEV